DEPIVPVAPAVTVWLRGISLPGEALSEPDERGEFDVQLGSLRTRVRLEQVERTAEPGAAREGRAPRELRVGGTATYAPPVGAGEEIEIRGQRIDEALPRVEEYLDLAARSGRARVRLIHGKGTGTLRKAVRELLERHPLVTAFESGQRTEGGDGVTIAYLASIH
ncbi:MAG: Smr/MutS family protein, partial [Chloroflexi bacterium]|nr:Smr/MutS family protein [Chloroflexota bacterium]